MRKILLANLRTHSRRYSAASIAVFISVIFVFVCLSLVSLTYMQVYNIITLKLQNSDVVVTSFSYTLSNNDDENAEQSGNNEPAGNNISTAVERVKSLSSVEDAQALEMTMGIISKGNDSQEILINNQRTGAFAVSPDIGKAVSAPNEVILDQKLADFLKVKIGDQVTLNLDNNSAYTVVGINTNSQSIFAGIPRAWVDSSVFSKQTEALVQVPLILVKSKPGQVTTALEQVKTVFSEETSYVQTTKNYQEMELRDFSSSLPGIIAVFLVFPVIAGFTAIIVISSTFKVMLAQRRRESALLRAVGAYSAQIRKLLVIESLTIGTISSVAALIVGSLGLAVVTQINGITHSWKEALGINSIWVFIGSLAFGVLLTLAASLGQSLRASRVTPIEALSPAESDVAARRIGWGKIILGGCLTVFGSLGIYVLTKHPNFGGVDPNMFFISFLLGLLTFAGFILFMMRALPYITLGISKLFNFGGSTLLIAGKNTWRNPARTGATGTALLVGVTIVSSILVGAASSKASADSALDQAAPVDMAVSIEYNQAPTQTQVQELSKLANVQKVVSSPSIKVSGIGNIYVADDLVDVTRESYPLPSDDEILLPPKIVKALNSSTITAYLSNNPETNNTGTQKVFKVLPGPEKMVNKKVFDQLSTYMKINFEIKNPELAGIYGEYSTLTQIQNIIFMKAKKDLTLDEVNRLTSSVKLLLPDSSISNPLSKRAIANIIIDVLLWISLAMLAVSVLVALVGVINTMALSVMERKRENSLLRALGITKGGLSRLLLAESLLITITTVAIGVGAGIGFAWLGIEALPLGEYSRVLVIPKTQLFILILGVIGAVLLASLLPARTATKASIVESINDI